MSRYVHRRWRDFRVGEFVNGTWHEAPRRVKTTNGRGHYYLGVVRHIDGSLTGITLPMKLERILLDLPIGSAVKITYLGERDIGFPHPVMDFDVKTLPPPPDEEEDSQQ
jgi:hypothetical protein